MSAARRLTPPRRAEIGTLDTASLLDRTVSLAESARSVCVVTGTTAHASAIHFTLRQRLDSTSFAFVSVVTPGGGSNVWRGRQFDAVLVDREFFRAETMREVDWLNGVLSRVRPASRATA